MGYWKKEAEGGEMKKWHWSLCSSGMDVSSRCMIGNDCCHSTQWRAALREVIFEESRSRDKHSIKFQSVQLPS